MDDMAQGASNLSAVQVEIFGQPFSLHGDPDHLLKLAQYVDSKMRTFAEKYTVNNFQLAVFAALRIAHENHLLKTRLDGERKAPGEEKTAGHPFTEEDKQRVRERRQRHHTRRWYERQLLAVAEGKLVMPNKEYKALVAFGRARGWNRRLSSKR